jgi:predicted Holliday junction resolvase-like endonuclease
LAFRGHELDEQYEQSGKTRREILKEYQDAKDEAIKMKKWLESK